MPAKMQHDVSPPHPPTHTTHTFSRLADQIRRFLNLVREHNLARLRKARRAAAKQEAAARKEEAAAVEAAVAAMLDSLGAAEAFEVAASGEGTASGSGGAPGDAEDVSVAPGSQSAGQGGVSLRRRHIPLAYEAPGAVPLGATGQQKGSSGGGGSRAGKAGRPGRVGPAAGTGGMEEEGKEGYGGPAAGAGGRGAAAVEEDEDEPSDAELLSLEWLRDAPDDEARNYLMSIDGEGHFLLCFTSWGADLLMGGRQHATT